MKEGRLDWVRKLQLWSSRQSRFNDLTGAELFLDKGHGLVEFLNKAGHAKDGRSYGITSGKWVKRYLWRLHYLEVGSWVVMWCEAVKAKRGMEGATRSGQQQIAWDRGRRYWYGDSPPLCSSHSRVCRSEYKVPKILTRMPGDVTSKGLSGIGGVLWLRWPGSSAHAQ